MCIRSWARLVVLAGGVLWITVLMAYFRESLPGIPIGR